MDPQDLSPDPQIPPNPPPLESQDEPPPSDPSNAALNVAFELLAAALSNSILMAPVWCGKTSPQAEQYSFGILRQVTLNLLFSAVRPNHEMKVLEEYFEQTRKMAVQWKLMAEEPRGSA